MKRIFTLLTVLLLSASIFAQAPEKISYQAVIRDASSVLVTNTTIGMQISLLQNSASGTPVYIETQTPTTNANGLVSIEIGTGTVISGDFASIDWAGDSYFIKTETDLAGGTGYTITGTNQLLSVPYALHAKTAENVTGEITETDPLYNVSLASGITAADTIYWNNKPDSYSETQTLADVLSLGNSAESQVASGFSQVGIGTAAPDNSALLELQSETQGFLPPRLTINQIKAISSPAEGLVIYNTNTTTLNLFNGSKWVDMAGQNAWPEIGDYYKGGYVFYIDASGFHGLVCSPDDIAADVPWGCAGTIIPGADGTEIGDGYQNTQDILAGCTETDIAARLCDSYENDGYTDWYLPSFMEVASICSKLSNNELAGFSNDDWHRIWTSTEIDPDRVECPECRDLIDLGWYPSQLKTLNTFVRVRAVRAF